MDWDKFLPLAEFSLNSTKSASTQHTPFYTLYGREPVLPMEAAVRNITDCKVESVADFVKRMESISKDVQEQLTRASAAMAKYANRRRRDSNISVGDKVWVSTKNLRVPAHLSRKLSCKFIGPYDVLQSIGPVAFKVDLPTSLGIHNVFHVSQLKLHVSGTAAQSRVPPSPVFLNDALEYEVEDILDVRVSRRNRAGRREFLIKWKGYPLYESTWEPESHLENC